MQSILTESGADFSPCRTWRYALWRYWDMSDMANCVAFIGLNPSTADETLDDPTIRRCIGFSKSWGFNGLIMLNAYAYRATDPNVMKAASDPLGPENLAKLAAYQGCVRLTIAAWGVHCDPVHALKVCVAVKRPIMCLGKTKSGAPKHPLYLAANTQRQPFWTPIDAAMKGENPCPVI